MGTTIDILSGSVLVAFAVLFAIIEIIAGAMVQAVAVNTREARRLREALEAYEKEHKKETKRERRPEPRGRRDWMATHNGAS